MKPRHAAFLSYSRADRVFAIELQEWLEGFQVPADLMANRANLGKNIGRIWRDETELPATSNLTAEIIRKLDESAFLIAICSADAACSQWVNKEIAHFQTRRPNRVLAVLAPGTIYDGNRPETFLPLALRPEVSGREPRPGGFSVPPRELGIADPGVDGRQVAFLRLAAGLLGVGFNDLSDRHAAREAEIRRKRSRLAAKTHYPPAQVAFAKGDAELALKHAVSAIIEGDDPTWSQAWELEATATEYAHSMRDLFRLRLVGQEGRLVPILKAVLTPDRRFLLVGAGTGEILVRDGTTGAPIAEIRCEDVWEAFKDRYSEYPAAAWRIWRNAWNNGPLTRVVISPWQECAILTHGVAATVWNTSDWTPTALDIHADGYNLFAFARSAPLAALGKVTQNETSTLSVINTRTGATVRTAIENWDPLAIAFSKAPEGESLVIVCSRGTLECIDPATGKRTEARKLSAERISHAAFDNGSALRFQAGNAGPSYLRRGSDGKWRRRPDPVLGYRPARSTQVAGVCVEARRAYTFSNNKVMLVEIPGSRKIASLDRGLNFGSFAPNGRRVLGMRNYQSIELLDSETGSAIASFGDEADRRCHPLISTSDDGLVSKLAWSPNGRWFALECHPPVERRVEDDLLAMRGGLFHPSFVEIREAESGEVAAAIPSLGHEIQFLGFTASNGHIWLLLDKHDLRLRGITDDRLIASAQCAGRVGQLAVSYDGRLVAAVEGRAIGKRREIRLFDSTQGVETRSIPLKNDVCRLAFRRSSPELIASMADGSIRLFDIETGTEMERFQEHDREKKLTILSIAASGDLIATATAEDKAGPVIVRDLRSATAPVCLLAGERHEITCVGFSEDGSIVACATREGECFAFETATGRQMFRADPGIGCPAEAIAFDGHHNQMTVVGETGLVRCYDATTGEPLLNHTMVLRNQEVGLDASIIVGSERKVIAAEYAVIQIFNVKTLRQQVLKDLDHKALLPMAISPDGSLLATASTDGAVRIWRIQDGLRTSILRGHRARVSALHFFPDGTRLASSDKAGTICIWNIADAYLKGKELTQWLRARVPLGVLTLKRRDDENLLLRDVLDKGEPGTRDLVAALDRFSSISE